MNDTINECKAIFSDRLNEATDLITAWSESNQPAEAFFTGERFGELVSALINTMSIGFDLIEALDMAALDGNLRTLQTAGYVEAVRGTDGESAYRLTEKGRQYAAHM